MVSNEYSEQDFKLKSRDPVKLDWAIEKLMLLSGPEEKRKVRFCQTVRALSKEPGNLELYPNNNTGHEPTKTLPDSQYELQYKLAWDAFETSFNEVWPKIKKDKSTSSKFKLLVADEYLKFFARNHFSYTEIGERKYKLVSSSFLFSDIELCRPNWPMTDKERDIIEELRDIRFRLVQHIRDDVEVLYRKGSKKNKNYFLRSPKPKISYHVALSVLLDSFFCVPFKVHLRELISSGYCQINQRRIPDLLRVKPSDFGNAFFLISNDRSPAPKNKNARNANQLRKDLLFAYLFSYLAVAQSEKLGIESLPSYKSSILEMTQRLFQNFHYAPVTTGQIKNFVQELSLRPK